MYYIVIDRKLGIMGRFETGDEADLWIEGHIARFPQAATSLERIALTLV
jgi:hypothetical protein